MGLGFRGGKSLGIGFQGEGFRISGISGFVVAGFGA